MKDKTEITCGLSTMAVHNIGRMDIMTVGNYKYGISLLPANCIAYRDGYRYGAYKQNLQDKDDMHITEFFKTEKEAQKFVNHNKEYGRG